MLMFATPCQCNILANHNILCNNCSCDSWEWTLPMKTSKCCWNVQNVNKNVNIAWNVVFVNASSSPLLVKSCIALHWNFPQNCFLNWKITNISGGQKLGDDWHRSSFESRFSGHPASASLRLQARRLHFRQHPGHRDLRVASLHHLKCAGTGSSLSDSYYNLFASPYILHPRLFFCNNVD